MRYATYFLLLGATFVSSTALAINKPASNIKEYALTNIQSVVTNHPGCAVTQQELSHLSQKHLVIQFHKTTKGFLTGEDLSGQIDSLNHTTIKQENNNHTMSRVAMGTFNLNGEKISYVMSLTTNVENPEYQYLYPIILWSHEGQCYYTGLISPSSKTIEAFKAAYKAGEASVGKDLAK